MYGSDLKGNRSGQRKWLCLDGDDWQWAYLDGRRVPATVPAGLAWSQGSVPFLETWIKLPPGRFGKWFRKTVTLPAWLKGDRYLLELSEVNCEATIFVNGRPVGYGAGALPVVADITAALKPGAANDLAICVRGGIGVMKPEFVDQYDPENWRIAQENEDVYHDSYGIPCLKSVHLRRCSRGAGEAEPGGQRRGAGQAADHDPVGKRRKPIAAGHAPLPGLPDRPGRSRADPGKERDDSRRRCRRSGGGIAGRRTGTLDAPQSGPGQNGHNGRRERPGAGHLRAALRLSEPARSRG